MNDLSASLRDAFLLEPNAAHLNHGSYGATPRVVFAAAENWRRRMEAQTGRIFQREFPAALRKAATRLAAFLDAGGKDLVFVDNATAGVNAVLRSFALQSGDEILATSHGYGAVARAMRYVASRIGAVVVEAPVPFPILGEDEIVAAVTQRFTARTRLLVLDHVTSPTAPVLPVARIAAAAKARGIAVLIDGAHAPGMLDLDIPALGVDFYVGNCHKWLFAPKGCAFLWTAPTMQAAIHPLVISHGYGGGFLAEFDWTGTRDPGTWLAIETALDFVETIGADVLRARNYQLRREAAALLCRRWAVEPPACSPFTALPPRLESAKQIRATLWDQHRIDVPAIPFAGRLWVRISAQIYNDIADYRRLGDALAG
jgi:isopenicillin-N epimerase